MIDPFARRDPHCKCSSPRDTVHALFAGNEPELCPVHDADTIQARTVDAERSAARAEVDRLRERRTLVDAFNNPPAACSCLSTAASVAAHLSGKPPAPCALHGMPASTPNDVALNDDTALAAVFGFPIRNTDTTTPPTAA